MIAGELIIGLVGASLSLGSGLFKTFKTSLKHHHPDEKEVVVVTVRTGDTVLEKRGMAEKNDVSTLLGLVDDSHIDPTTPNPAGKS